MLIGVSGYSGVGKDTVGIIIQYLLCNSKEQVSIEEVISNYANNEWWLEESSGWEIKKFAGKLKNIASHLTGIDVEKFEDQEFKKTNLGPEWNVLKIKPGKRQDGIFPKKVDMESVPMTVRDFLQKLGTDAMRMGLHDNVWCNALFADYVAIPQVGVDITEDNDYQYPNWIITDTRFPNEAQAIKDKGGIIIRIDRPGIVPINNHPSEIGLDGWNFDYKIANVSDVVSLMFTVENILKHHKII
jgi:hypothetical protein